VRRLDASLKIGHFCQMAFVHRAPAKLSSRVVNRIGSGGASGRRGFDLDAVTDQMGADGAIANKRTLLAAPLGSTWNCLSIRRAPDLSARVLGDQQLPTDSEGFDTPANSRWNRRPRISCGATNDVAHDHRRVDADAHLELRSALRDETLVDVSHGELHGSPHATACRHGPRRHRRAKDHEDSVAMISSMCRGTGRSHPPSPRDTG